jgi:hypothetical protein
MGSSTAVLALQDIDACRPEMSTLESKSTGPHELGDGGPVPTCASGNGSANLSG